MAQSEIVYLGRDNSIDLLLMADRVAVDLSSVTQVDLRIGTTVISSTTPASGPIRWAQAGYQTGELRLYLGDQALTVQSAAQAAWLVIYDPANPGGIVWGSLVLFVQSGI